MAVITEVIKPGNNIPLINLFSVLIFEAGVLHNFPIIFIRIIHIKRTTIIKNISFYNSYSTLIYHIEIIKKISLVHFLFSFIPYSKFNFPIHKELENCQLAIFLLFLPLKMQS